MNFASSTVLITGGASGIGLALAARFHAAGGTVLACGRREEKLREAAGRLPGLVTRVCDLARPADRRALAAWAVQEHPTLNVLVNNAGIQRYPRVEAGEGDWEKVEEEIAVNLEAPVHLSMLLASHLRQRPEPAIVNVTSGLAFAPLARAAVYSATKAALHSFTLSMRHQLSQTPVKVIEIAPPAVDTDLGGPGLHTFGVNVDEFADGIFARLGGSEVEIGHGFTDGARQASRAELDQLFQRVNAAQP
jgi:uncharacterized oxidoreductase